MRSPYFKELIMAFTEQDLKNQKQEIARLAVGTAQHEQPAHIALFGRSLRDEFPWQLVPVGRAFKQIGI